MGLEAAREAEQDIWYNGYMEVAARCCKWHGKRQKTALRSLLTIGI